ISWTAGSNIRFCWSFTPTGVSEPLLSGMRRKGIMWNSKTCMDYAEAAVLHTYNRFPVVFEKGQGVYLEDLEGKRYLDFGAGIAVFALGYGVKEYNEALKEQIDKIIHTS